MNEKPTYYPHRYVFFDHLCQEKEDYQNMIDFYCSHGMSTPIEEAVKYLLFQSFGRFYYVLKKYADALSEDHFVHLIIGGIIWKVDVIYFKIIAECYKNSRGYEFMIDERREEIFWLVCRSDRIEIKMAIIECFSFDTVTFNKCKGVQFSWQKEDPANPRNLIYALMERDIERAKKLIVDGTCVDSFNNYPMFYVSVVSELKSDTELCKLMFLYGAKLPAISMATRKLILNHK